MPSILKFILICILHPSDASRNPGQVNWNMIDSVSKYQFINVNLTIETQSVQENHKMYVFYLGYVGTFSDKLINLIICEPKAVSAFIYY